MTNRVEAAARDDGRRPLDERGWIKLDLTDRLDALFAAEGDAAGAEFRQEPGAPRLANLMDKAAVFLDCILEAEVLGLVAHVLGRRFKLSSLNARSAEPGEAAAQPLVAAEGQSGFLK